MRTPDRLELRVTHVGLAGRPRDVVARSAATATVADLALALHNGASGGRLFSLRAGPLPADALLHEGVVRDGDVLHDAPPAAMAGAGRGAGGLELCVVGGPSAGARFPLTSPVTTIGRTADATVVLDDPSLSHSTRRCTSEVAEQRSPTTSHATGRTSTAAVSPPARCMRCRRTTTSRSAVPCCRSDALHAAKNQRRAWVAPSSTSIGCPGWQ